jgi:hypothetical protein
MKLKKIELEPTPKVYPRDRLFIKIGKTKIKFHAYIDGAGNYFEIDKEELIK